MVEICIHLSDGFPVLSLTLITEPLRVANRELGRARFTWSIVSDTGGALRSSSGMDLHTLPSWEQTPDAAIVLASYRPERSATDATLAWLRGLDRRGCLLGCVDTGALVLARAGLLGARPAAVHPEAIDGFQRQFPESLFMDRLHDFSPPRFSSAGGVATLDMTLALIGHFSHERLARSVAEILTYDPAPPGGRARIRSGSVAPAVRDAVALMEAHPRASLGIPDIADRVGVPVWKLNRLFQRYLHSSPTSYYVDLRLSRARDMLRNTTMAIGDVATACGYDNAEYL